MAYNERLLRDLEQLSNSELNKTGIEEGKKIFDSQLNSSKKIVKAFTTYSHPDDELSARNRHILLLAQMQSGKTGVINGVINILEHDNGRLAKAFGIEKYYLITGMNDNGLHSQTVKRLLEQVITATDPNTDSGSKDKEKCDTCKFIVHKNFDLRNSSHELSKCIIFVDESHYGSGEFSILSQFFNNNGGINWKNSKILNEKEIYIVSISATIYDELVSDVSDNKQRIVLEPGPNYFGIREFYQNGQIEEASSKDFTRVRNSRPRILELIEQNHSRFDNGLGAIVVRAQGTKKSRVILQDEWINQTFKIVELNAKSGKIDYEKIELEVKAMKTTLAFSKQKPLLFILKGAYRAGMSLDSAIKDEIYMVYDPSDVSHAQPQNFLGRMCGYRDKIDSVTKTKFYVNLQHAESYVNWVENNFSKQTTPAPVSWINPSEVTLSDLSEDLEKKIRTEKINKFEIILSNHQVKSLKEADREFLKNFVKTKLSIDFDFISETYLRGTSSYTNSVIEKWFTGESVSSPRPNKEFENLFGRNEFDVELDNGRTFIHLSLDDLDNKLIVFYGRLVQKIKARDFTKLIKEHKDTSKV